ncbi:hypothetical protein LRAMOSA03786 [Lichtheimia ramosa]|uniref:Transmembrane 9 superfamily member n=1 Tax=Lichtheimia ramosa TaxID=688394 RepID=A0A077WWY7_9FUNG|nr:hypothetical protein LRAMOSA03786 [Lichtheimia ramosa]
MVFSAKLALLAIGGVGLANAFYLPGVSPKDYSDGDNVPLYVNSLTPMSNQQLKSLLAYDYYDPRFHFCQPEGGPQQQSESLGSIMFGDRIFSSPFQLFMGKDETCKRLCVSETIPKDDAQYINQCINDGYALNFVVDGLPAAHISTDERTDEEYYSIGFRLGESDAQGPVLNNHYDIYIDYHERPDGKKRVVGVIVTASSFDRDPKAEKVACDGGAPLHLKEDGSQQVVYTYSVNWRASKTAWATRWDNYLHVLDPSIHWFSLVNSVVIVLFLTGMVAMILLRALHRDISRYNAVEAQEDVQEDYGWKLVHGDVFRAPARSMLLSVLVGSGAQLVAMVALTLVFSVLGFLSPSNRGALATVMVIFFMLFGSIAGFVSARIYKMNGGENWKLNILLSATLLPGLIAGSLLTLNFFLIGSQSSGAVPFGTMIAIAGIWLLISLPLSVVGAYFGFRKPRIEHPVRTNQIPRQIPDQPFYLRPVPSIFMGGILPFGAIFIELYFVMNSIWFHRIYYGIGFLFLVFVVLILTCSEVTILLCYFHLCSEDYHWSWRALLTSGAAGFYVFMYSILYYLTKLDINFTSTILYFGYSGVISLLFSLLSGSVGYIACLVFLQKIFASIKVD